MSYTDDKDLTKALLRLQDSADFLKLRNAIAARLEATRDRLCGVSGEREIYREQGRATELRALLHAVDHPRETMNALEHAAGERGVY